MQGVSEGQAEEFEKLLGELGDIITMDHCSFYDHVMKYALSGDAVALVVRYAATTFGYVCPRQSKDTDNAVAAL